MNTTAAVPAPPTDPSHKCHVHGPAAAAATTGSAQLYREARAAEEREVREGLSSFWLVEIHLQSSDGASQGCLAIKYVVDSTGLVWHVRNPSYYLPHYATCSVSQLDFTFHDEDDNPHTVKLIDGYMIMLPLVDVFGIVTVRRVIGPIPPTAAPL